jgi:glycosyltransferase involved in cell wall biosynthesis
MPTVSVIIPTYNRRDRLSQAIASVLAQTWTDFEVLVVDDQSPDDTGAFVGGLGDSRIRYLRMERNGGPSACRNRGLKEAKGRFAAFLDDDDRWEPEKLARQLEAVEGTENPICFTGVSYLEGERKHEPPQPGYDGRAKLGDALFLKGCVFFLSSLLVNRERATEIGFDEGLRQHEDWLFLLRLEAAGGRLIHVPKPLTIMARDDERDGLSDRYEIPVVRKWLDLAAPHLSADALASYRANVFARYLLRAGRIKEAVSCLADARKRGIITTRRMVGVFAFAASPALQRHWLRRARMARSA